MGAENLRSQKNSFRITEIETLALQPPENIPAWEWVEKHRILDRRSASEPGPKRISRTPALKCLYDWFEDLKIREVVIQKPAQIGLTDVVVDLILWIAVNDPSPTALFLADADTARKILKFRIVPALKSMGLVSHQSAAKSQDVTKFEVTLRNGFYLAVSWGSSVSQTASMAFKRVFIDEVNKPGYDAVKQEGGALGRIRERTETYPDSKIFVFSSPTLDTGRITQELESCDAIFDFQVECPSCHEHQALTFKNVVWEGGSKAKRDQIIKTARYKCRGCGELWTEAQRKAAVLAGATVLRDMADEEEPQGNTSKIGYQLHRLVSLFKGGALPEMIRRWNSAQDDVLELQNVINSVFGEPFVPRISAKQEDAIEQIMRCRSDDGPGIMPEKVLCLVCGIDVQQNGFWYRLRAFLSNMTSFGVEEGFVTTWEELEAVVFRHEIGLPKVWRAMIDTGGGREEGARISRTEETYHWIRKNRGRGVRIFGCKGSPRALPTKIKFGTPLERTPSGKPIPGGLQIIHVNTEAFKEALWWRIDKTNEDHTQPGCWFVHCETTEGIAGQIAAEEKRRTRNGGIEWVKVKRENHMLDCEILCLVAVDFELRGGIRPLQMRRIMRLREKRVQEQAAQIQEANPPKPQPTRRNPHLSDTRNPYIRRFET